MPEEKIKLVNECKEKEKATDADVQELIGHGLPTTQTGKCLSACVMENLGGVSTRFKSIVLILIEQMIETSIFRRLKMERSMLPQ